MNFFKILSFILLFSIGFNIHSMNFASKLIKTSTKIVKIAPYVLAAGTIFKTVPSNSTKFNIMAKNKSKKN